MRALPAAAVLTLLTVAACGFDWTVEPAKGKPDGGSIANVPCPDGCASNEYCLESIQNGSATYKCPLLTCAKSTCACAEVAASCACDDRSSLVVVSCK